MRTRTAPLLLALAATFLLAGCAGTTSSESDLAVANPDGLAMQDGAVEGGAPAVSGEMSVDGKSAAAPAAVPTDRQIIRTGYMALVVTDVGKATFDVHGLIKKRDGLVSSEDVQGNGEYTYASITAQIPAAALDDFIADVSALGDVESININAQDVTTQVVDLDARIAALETSIDRLTDLLAAASRIEDLLTIESQLSTRQAELDSLTAQRTYLGDQVALSTITVTLSPEPQVTSVDAPGFLSGLESGWAAFVSVIMVAVTAVGFFLPFLVVLLVIAIPIVLVIVRQARRHRTTTPLPTQPPQPPRQEAPSQPTT